MYIFFTLCNTSLYFVTIESLISENVVSGRSTWRWRAASASARARRRYVRVQSALRDAHSDLAALHFASFLCDPDDTDTSETQEPGEVLVYYDPATMCYEISTKFKLFTKSCQTYTSMLIIF